VSRAVGRGLGRGLASLIPDGTFDDPQGGAALDVRQVPIAEIRPNPEQPRTHFDDAELQGLARSIRRDGILVPLVVRRAEGRYWLVAGERRLRAAALAGLSDVPVVVRDVAGADAQLELALVENLQRADLDPIEEARGYARLVDVFGLTQGEVAERVGKDRSTVANAVRLLALPEFALESLRDGRISAGHARALLPLDDASALKSLVARIADEGLSVRAVEGIVRAGRKTPADPADRERRLRTVAHARQKLARQLGVNVDIRPRKDGGGRILLDFADREQLDALIDRLGRA